MKRALRVLFALAAFTLSVTASRAQLATNNGATVKTNTGCVVYIGGSLNNASGTFDNSGALTVNGNVTNGGTLTDSGTITFNGNWTNTSTFNRGTGSVILNGGAQSFLGSQVTTFNNLTITGGNTKTFSQAEIVDGTLDLTRGLLATTETNLLTFTTAGNWTNGSDTSYVNGPAAKDFNSTTEFRLPVGKAGRFNTVGVKPAISSATTFRGEYFDSAYSNTHSLYTPLVEVSGVQYWNVDRTSGSANGYVRLYWISGDYGLPGLISSTNHLLVARFSDTAWAAEGRGEVNGDYLAGNILSSGVTTWSGSPNERFTIGADSIVNCLPVELDHFSAQQIDANVRLEWLTRSEIQNLGFEIERHNSEIASTVIQSWQTEKALSAKSQYGGSYHTLDVPPSDGIWTYDLYQRDVDGSRWHIATETLLYTKNAGMKSLALSLYPNPTPGVVQALLAVPRDVSSALIELYDGAGRKVSDMTLGPLAKGNNSVQLQDLQHLPNGRYTVILRAGEERVSSALIMSK